MGELGAVEQLDGGVEGVAVDVDDVLGQVAGELELRDEGVGLAQFVGEVELLEAGLFRKDLVDLLREDLVLDFFAVEELGPF